MEHKDIAAVVDEEFLMRGSSWEGKKVREEASSWWEGRGEGGGEKLRESRQILGFVKGEEKRGERREEREWVMRGMGYEGEEEYEGLLNEYG